MVWWILLAGLVLGLLVLGLAARPVLRRLPALRQALTRLTRQAGEAQKLEAGAEMLRQRAEALAERAAQAQATAAARGSARSRESAR